MIRLAEIKEKEGVKSGRYPPEWVDVARKIKEMNNWKCERCGVRNNEDEPDGTMLTVHHLDGNKFNLEYWNLAALCQRCHLRVQARVDFLHIPLVWDWVMNRGSLLSTHSYWMSKHIKDYNLWAWLNDKPRMPLEKIIDRDYSREWKK